MSLGFFTVAGTEKARATRTDTHRADVVQEDGWVAPEHCLSSALPGLLLPIWATRIDFVPLWVSHAPDLEKAEQMKDLCMVT